MPPIRVLRSKSTERRDGPDDDLPAWAQSHNGRSDDVGALRKFKGRLGIPRLRFVRIRYRSFF